MYFSESELMGSLSERQLLFERYLVGRVSQIRWKREGKDTKAEDIVYIEQRNEALLQPIPSK